MKINKERGLESFAAGQSLKYGGKIFLHYLPQIRILLALILVRIGIKKSISFKHPHMLFASTWARRLNLMSDTISFPGGLKMHRAIGVPEYDNSHVTGVMTFKKISKEISK